jgi:hypothetical protein
MTLPVKPLATDSVEIGGERVDFRSLSRSEALQLQAFRGREDEAEVFILARGSGVSEDEARAWREQVDTETAGVLIDGILFLSGLAQKDAEGNLLTSNKPLSGP